MPTFFMHLKNAHGFQRDDEGADFADLDAARTQAIRTGADILAEEIKGGCQTVRLTFYIDDADQRRLATVPMTASIGHTAPD